MPVQTPSFEQAIAQATQLLDAQAAGALDGERLYRELAQLVSTANGARGFFVTFLPGRWAAADQVPEEVLAALRSAPELVAELMIKNLAMSTAMILAHRERGDEQAALGSDQVARRSAALIGQLKIEPLTRHLEQLRRALTTGEGDYATFLQRWGYGSEQREAISRAVAELSIPGR
ncbi:MAG: hypothetical protein KME03_08950 [Aphanocapsa lilacina HA4352-LM1]|jgi:hypothetical protein|nr:hypothetical protein [Aphanocapsa lilacina HA4352-LM1]